MSYAVSHIEFVVSVCRRRRIIIYFRRASIRNAIITITVINSTQIKHHAFAGKYTHLIMFNFGRVSAEQADTRWMCVRAGVADD